MFGFIGFVIQISDDDKFNCYDFGLSNNPILNENKPILFLIFSGTSSNGHFRFLKSSSKRAAVIPNGLYSQKTNLDMDMTTITNIPPKNPKSVILNDSKDQKFVCQICPQEQRKFFDTKKGLRIHSSKKHPGIDFPESRKQESYVEDELKYISRYKAKIRLLKRIPKGARVLAANKLSTIVNECISKNFESSWENLMLFSFKSLYIPDKSTSSSLVASVKNNISKFTLPPIKNLNQRKKKTLNNEDELIAKIEAKVADFDIRGAVRLLTSEDSVAISNENTLKELQDKHPSPSREINLPERPTKENEFYTVNEKEVKKAINSFKNGSASGLDGLSPQYIKDMISHSAGDAGIKALSSITRLCNLVLSGQVNANICKYLYGATLQKKCGGIRPIAIGNFLRRIVSKLACIKARKEMGEYFRPHQIGFGSKLGCEAAVHDTRSTVLASKIH